MKILKYYLLASILISLSGCESEEIKRQLSPDEDLLFSGTFKTINSEKVSGTATLQISSGHYYCETDLPFGHGAGKIEISDATLNFIDTLFFAAPAIYGPSYVLSGKYFYEFDGKNLNIEKEKNIGSVQYKLKLK